MNGLTPTRDSVSNAKSKRRTLVSARDSGLLRRVNTSFRSVLRSSKKLFVLVLCLNSPSDNSQTALTASVAKQISPVLSSGAAQGEAWVMLLGVAGRRPVDYLAGLQTARASGTLRTSKVT